MDFENVRSFIVASGIVPKATLKDDPENEIDAIFLYGKPEEIEADQYLVYNFRLNSARIVQNYTFNIKVCSKDLLKAVELKDNVASLLDFYCRPVEIENFIKFRLSSEDGFNYDPDTGYYVGLLSFDCNYVD